MTRDVSPGRSVWKLRMIRFVLFVFGRAAQVLSRIDPEVRREVSRWPEGFVIRYTVLPHGPSMVLARTRAGRLAYRGGGDDGAPAGLTVALKNVRSALLIFTFRVGMQQAYAQNRVSVRGDVPTALSQMRVLNRVLAYMLPEKVVRRITLRTPEIGPFRKYVSRGFLYLFGIPFGV